MIGGKREANKNSYFAKNTVEKPFSFLNFLSFKVISFYFRRNSGAIYISFFDTGRKRGIPYINCFDTGRKRCIHEKEEFVIPTKSFFKIGMTKIFCYTNKMFSSTNKTFGC